VKVTPAASGGSQSAIAIAFLLIRSTNTRSSKLMASEATRKVTNQTFLAFTVNPRCFEHDQWGCKHGQRTGYPIHRRETRSTLRHDGFSEHAQVAPVTSTVVAEGQVRQAA
jgi:hypothetical protein